MPLFQSVEPWLQVRQLQADRQLYSSISSASPWHFTGELLKKMADEFLENDAINWGSHLAPLADARHWAKALCLLKHGRSEINVRNVVLSSMRAEWQLASELFQELAIMKLQPDELTFKTHASSFSSAATWQDAIHLGNSAVT